MLKFHLILLFLFSPVWAMQKNDPSIPSSDRICHLALLPVEIRDRIAQLVLYENDQEFAARAIANYRKQKDKIQPKYYEISGFPRMSGAPSTIKFSPSKRYCACFTGTIFNTVMLTIVGPLCRVYDPDSNSHIIDYRYSYDADPMINKPCYNAFNKQQTSVIVLNADEAQCLHALPDRFIEEKSGRFCEENSLKNFFYHKLVCKDLNSSLVQQSS